MTIRMKDIAKDLGLSQATVSKVLRDHPDIGESTRQRVLRTRQRAGLPAEFPRTQPGHRAQFSDRADRSQPASSVLCRDRRCPLQRNSGQRLFSDRVFLPGRSGTREGRDIAAARPPYGCAGHCVHRIKHRAVRANGQQGSTVRSASIAIWPAWEPTSSASMIKEPDIWRQSTSSTWAAAMWRTSAGRTTVPGIGRFEGYKQALRDSGLPYSEDYVVRRSYVDIETTRQGAEAMRLLLERDPEARRRILLQRSARDRSDEHDPRSRSKNSGRHCTDRLRQFAQ